MRNQRRVPSRVTLILGAATLAVFANLAAAVTPTSIVPARAQEKAPIAPVAPITGGRLGPALTPSASTPIGSTNTAPVVRPSESIAKPAAAVPISPNPAPDPATASTGAPEFATPAAAAGHKPATPAAPFKPTPPADSPTVAPLPTALTTPAGAVVPAISQVPTTGTAPTFSAPSFNPLPVTEVVAEAAFEPGQLLVMWSSELAAANGLATIQERYQLRPRQRYTLANLGFVLVMYLLPGDREARLLRDQLQQQQPSWTVDLNARSTPLQVSEKKLPEDAIPRFYAAKMLGDIASATSVKLDSSSLRLGVIDTGVDGALALPAALNGSILKVRSVLGPADKAASTAHGNAVLQLMVGAPRSNGFSGYAPPLLVSWVSSMRELNAVPSTNSLMLSVALDWLVGEQVSLINMSLGGQGDEILKKVIARVLEKNVTIVAAVGNGPARLALPVYPAAYPGVWAVAAVDAAGRLYGEGSRASYTVLAAPGAELWVPSDQLHSNGAYVSGTSYAAALASATVAWQSPGFWALSATQRRDRVCSQARKVPDQPEAGCGLVQKNLQ